MPVVALGSAEHNRRPPVLDFLLLGTYVLYISVDMDARLRAPNGS